MEQIIQTHSASDAVRIINANLEELGSEVTISASDSASLVCSKLNSVFAVLDEPTELTSSMSGSEFIVAVNANFEALAEGSAGIGTLKLLHWSDTHDAERTTPRVNSLLGTDNSLYAIFTGDAGNEDFNGPGSTMYTIPDAYKTRLLMCAGNHDVYDTSVSNGNIVLHAQKRITQKIVEQIGETQDSPIVWGGPVDEEDGKRIASYYYRDIVANGANKKVRVIVLDQYEVDVCGLPSNITDTSSAVYPYAKHRTIYSQAQIDWFIGALQSMKENDVDYFIIAQHEPPVEHSNANSDFLREARRANKFIAATNGAYPENLSNHYGVDYNWCVYQNGGVIARIVNAYLNKSQDSFSFHNYLSGDASYNGDNDVVQVNVDFTREDTIIPFLFWLCGHVHREYCGYHPNYPNQLILCVDCAKWAAGGGWSDLNRSSTDDSEKVVLNKVTINFSTRKILVERIGDNIIRGLTVAGQYYKGTNETNGVERNWVQFNFKRKNGEFFESEDETITNPSTNNEN